MGAVIDLCRPVHDEQGVPGISPFANNFSVYRANLQPDCHTGLRSADEKILIQPLIQYQLYKLANGRSRKGSDINFNDPILVIR